MSTSRIHLFPLVAGIQFGNLSDPRTIAISDLSRSLDDADKVSTALRADPNAAAGDVASRLGDSAYARRFKQEADAGKSTSEIAAAFKAEMKPVDDILGKTENIGKAVDDLAAGKVNPAIRQKEVARQLGALASIDPNVARLFKAVDDAKVTNVPKIIQYVQKLATDAPDSLASFKKGLLYDAASTAVYKATKDMSALDNLVAATKNTFVDRKFLPEILDRVGASRIGQVGKALADSNVVFKADGQKILPAFDNLDDTTKASINSSVRELTTFRKLSQSEAAGILSNLDSGYILTKDLRTLIDANVDLVAEALVVGTGKKITRGRDVARLPVQKSSDLLVPLENRAFSREVLKEWVGKVTGQKAIKSNLSVGQQRILQDAIQRASSLDIKLEVAQVSWRKSTHQTFAL